MLKIKLKKQETDWLLQRLKLKKIRVTQFFKFMLLKAEKNQDSAIGDLVGDMISDVELPCTNYLGLRDYISHKGHDTTPALKVLDQAYASYKKSANNT